MIDLHTHILPGIDDGSKSPEMSFAMLRAQQAQGVDTVVLTPHFYRSKEELPHFLRRRAQALAQLQAYLDRQTQPLPRLMLGAEVAWVANMPQWEQLSELCITGTRNLLLELPFTRWHSSMIDQIYELMDMRNITPIIAHLERYLRDQPKDLIAEILAMDVPIQVSADPLLHLGQKRPVLQLLASGHASVMASDCHNPDRRPPNLKQGMAVAEKKFGPVLTARLDRNARRLVGL